MKFTVLSSLAVLVAGPAAFAEDAVDVKPPAVIEESPVEPEVIVEEPAPADDAEPVAGSGDESVEVEVSEPGGEVAGEDEGTAIPIDWVKRGDGENPDVMFYNTAGGEAPVFKDEVSKEIGQDEKGAAIENGENAAGPQIQREKKGPVALIKKGRVFLR